MSLPAASSTVWLGPGVARGRAGYSLDRGAAADDRDGPRDAGGGRAERRAHDLVTGLIGWRNLACRLGGTRGPLPLCAGERAESAGGLRDDRPGRDRQPIGRARHGDVPQPHRRCCSRCSVTCVGRSAAAPTPAGPRSSRLGNGRTRTAARARAREVLPHQLQVADLTQRRARRPARRAGRRREERRCDRGAGLA